MRDCVLSYDKINKSDEAIKYFSEAYLLKTQMFGDINDQKLIRELVEDTNRCAIVDQIIKSLDYLRSIYARRGIDDNDKKISEKYGNIAYKFRKNLSNDSIFNQLQNIFSIF